jgi:hypothetical protein
MLTKGYLDDINERTVQLTLQKPGGGQATLGFWIRWPNNQLMMGG